MACEIEDSDLKHDSIMNEDDQYKWLFLYASLTDEQRDEFHNSSSQPHSEDCNNTVNSQNTDLNDTNNHKITNLKKNENSLKQKTVTSTVLNECSDDSIQSDVESHIRSVNFTNHIEANKNTNFTAQGSTSSPTDTLNDQNTYSHTLDSSNKSTDYCNSNKSPINHENGDLCSSIPDRWEKVNNIVSSTNYEKYIDSDNFLDIVTKLKNRFTVNFIKPIWNNVGISLKLKIKIVLLPQNFSKSYLPIDKGPLSISKFDRKLLSNFQYEEHEDLKYEMDNTKDTMKKRWISRLLQFKCLEMTFMIRDGGVNTAYKSAVKFRNYFHGFVNESLSRNNIIVISNTKQDPDLIKFDSPNYFKSRDEINFTNSARIFKFVTILNRKLNRYSISSRTKRRELTIDMFDDALGDGSSPELTIKKAKLSKEPSPKVDKPQPIKHPVLVNNRITITNERSSSKKGWDMKRLRMCIIDPPPLPEYYTFSLNLAHTNNSNKDNGLNLVSNRNNNTNTGNEAKSKQTVGKTTNPNTTNNNSNTQLFNIPNSTKQNNIDVHNNFNTNAAEHFNPDKINEYNQNDVYDYRNFTQISNNEKFDVIIIGAGVGGLGAANYLSKKGLKVAVIEARNRIGGRMFTTYFPKITLDSHSHTDVVTNLFNRYDNKYDTKKYFNVFNEDCTNLPEMNIDLGPNYLHCNNLFFNPKDEYDTTEPKVQIGVEVTNKRDGLSNSINPNGPELNEKALLFNPYKDVRNKRGTEKSILGLASLLRPSVGDISGFSNWEPTLYTNWYNETIGRKINFSSVVKVNMIVDQLLLRTSKYFYKMTHSFFTSYNYVDKPSARKSCTPTNNNNIKRDESTPFCRHVDIKANVTNTVDSKSTASKANIKMELDGSNDLNSMVTTTTSTDDSTNGFSGNLSSSSSSSCIDNCDFNYSCAGYKHTNANVVDTANSTPTLIYDCHNGNYASNLTDSFKATGARKDVPDDNYTRANTKNKVKTTLEQSGSKSTEKHVKDVNESKTKNTKNLRPDPKNDHENHASSEHEANKACDHNTSNTEPVVLRKSTRIKKLSSFVLYNENLDEMTPSPPSETKSAKKQPPSSNNKMSNKTNDIGDSDKHEDSMKKPLSPLDVFLKNRNNKLHTLWDLYITIYFDLLKELRRGLKSDLNTVEEKLLFAILQSRLGYNSDLRETCISMSKLPMAFHSLYSSYHTARDQNTLSENSTPSNDHTNHDSNYPNDSSTSTTNDNTVHIPSNINTETDDRISIFDERTISIYRKNARKHYDRLTKLNISRFDGKSDSDKLVINGWGWLLNHLIRNIKNNIYLNTKLLKITVLDDKLGNNSSNHDDHNAHHANNLSVLESDEHEITPYNIKLSIVYNENSITSFNNVTFTGHIPNFTNYDFFDHGEPDVIQTSNNRTFKSNDTKGKASSPTKHNNAFNKSHMANNTNKSKPRNNDTNPNASLNDKMDLDTNEAKPSNLPIKSSRIMESVKKNQNENSYQEVKHIYSKYVLVTVPNSLLSEIEFEPKLDDNKLSSLKNYDMGFHNKIIMRFKPCEVFWPKNELQFNCLDSSFQFMNLDAYGKKGCLLAHSFPPFSKCFVKINKEILLMRCLDLLHKMFNLQTRIYPVQAFVTNWKSDPFSRGSYSYPTKYARDEDVIHLKSPHPFNNPKVLFSGEYISNSYYQCIDGSYDTSIRAAEDIYNLGLRNETKSSTPFIKNTSSTPNKLRGQTDTLDNTGTNWKMYPNNPTYANPYNTADDTNMDFYKREKYLDNILNNDHNDNFIGLPIPSPPKDLLGFYLTDGSDELFSDDNDFITFPTNFIKSVYESNRHRELKSAKRKHSDVSNEFHSSDANEELSNETKTRKVLDEVYSPINPTNTDKPAFNNSNNTIDITNSTKTDDDLIDQISNENSKELELLLIIKSIFNQDNINVSRLLEDYGKFNEILIYLIKNHHINKYTYYSNIIIISLLTTIFHELKPSNKCEDSDNLYKNERDPDNSYDRLNEKILSELNNFKDVNVNIRNQKFSRQMANNMSSLIGLRHDYLCYHCLRGGEVILCDKEGCDSVWHYDCLPESFKPATRHNFNDVKFETDSTTVKHESNTWNCPKCSKFPIKRGEKSCSRDVQLYWIRRGYWWRVKAIISVSLQIYKRIQELTGH